MLSGLSDAEEVTLIVCKNVTDFSPLQNVSKITLSRCPIGPNLPVFKAQYMKLDRCRELVDVSAFKVT